MESIELKAEAREATGRQVKHLRREGLVPAVMYGSDMDATLLQIDAKTLGRVLAQAGTHQLISLKIGRKKPQLTLARDIQRDPVRRNYLHVDFFAVKMDQKITARVPVVLEGESPAVEAGGILTQALNEIEVECLPQDLIGSVVVNIEGLAAINDAITVADLTVPSEVALLADPDTLVVRIEAPRSEEELEALEEPVSAEPEVVRKAREEEEEGEEE